VLLLGDIGVGLLLTILATVIRARQHRRGAGQFGELVTNVVPSFGLAVLVFEGLLPGVWMIAGYALYGGTLENHLLPGASVANLLRALAIGLVVSTYAAARAYVALLSRRHRR